MARGPVHELLPLRPVDFHVLLVLSDEPRYGYAIMKAVAEESEGTVAPEIGSLYRVLGRLVGQGLVVETGAPPSTTDAVHPGRERRYYGLTDRGREAIRAEALRLGRALALADGRDLLPERGRP